MLKELIGTDAKYIKELLIPEGKLTIEDLERLTGYRNAYIFLVLGWLTKEGSISYREAENTLIIILNNKNMYF